MKKKRRRLRKPFRVALKVAKVAGIVGVSSTVMMSTQLKDERVYAEDMNQTTSVVQVIGQLQKGQNNTLQTLKDCAVAEAQNSSSKQLNDDNLTVTISVPAVVTTPSIENIKVTVSEDISKQNPVSPVTQSEDASSNTNTTATTIDQTKENTYEENNEQTTTSEITERSGDEETDEEINEKFSVSLFAEKSSEVIIDTSDSELTYDETADHPSFSLDNTNENILGATAVDTSLEQVIGSSSVTLVELTDEIIESSQIEEDISGKTKEEMPALSLKQDHVYLNLGDQVKPNSFIANVSDDHDGSLPFIQIDSNVDTSTEGDYTITYTVTGTNSHQTVSKTLTVIVGETEEAKAQRLAAEEKSLQAMRQLSMLGTDRSENKEMIAISGSDARINTLKSMCTEAKGYTAGVNGVLQCVDIGQWYIVNAFHKPSVRGNGKDIAGNLLAQHYDDIVQVSGPGAGVLFSQYSNASALGAIYGHVAYINEISEDGTIAYVTQGQGSDGGFQEYYPWKMSDFNSSNYCFVTTRENAEALGLEIIV